MNSPSSRTARRWIASLLLIGVVLGTGALLAAWKLNTELESAAASANQPEPVELVTVATAQTREHHQQTTAIGTVLALRSVTLRNELPGTVERVALTPGQIVEPGTVLVAFDASVFRESVKFSAAEHAQARVCIIASELVLRGAEWLARRWADPTPKYKHMALARRASGLTASQFQARWRSRPGRIGGANVGQVIDIPESARGLAYVQNHRQSAEPRYDAIYEVYFGRSRQHAKSRRLLRTPRCSDDRPGSRR